jgi:ATP-dependent RNA helicase DeaD
MSNTPDLATLTIKDLRTMAGEHQIHNSSRMGKERLIGLLQGVIAARAAEAATPVAAPAAEAVAEIAPLALQAAAAGSAEPEVITIDQSVPVAAPSAEAHAVANDEPEVLDAAAVSELAGEPSQTEPDEGEPRRRRRRRRRRGGRGGNGGPNGHANDAQGASEDGSDEGEDDREDEQAPAASAPLPSPTDVTEVSAPAAVTPAAAAETEGAAVPVDNERPVEPRPQAPQRPTDGRPPRDQNREAGREPRRDGQGSDERAPRPRLNGPQRPVPSVLDRLSVFTRGILELCDPATPSWAQPRLAELLADAGVVPLPCQGQPHLDYHRVIGTIATSEVPAGHIAEIASQGFCLRGDRGDLFCLRRADVRIAGERTEDRAPAPAAEIRAPDADRPPRSERSEPRPERGDGRREDRPEGRRDDRSDGRRDDRRRDQRPPRDAQGEQAEPTADATPREGGFRPPRAERRGGPTPILPDPTVTEPVAATPAPISVSAPVPVADALPGNEPEELNLASEPAEAPAPQRRQPRPPLPSPGRSPEHIHPRESAQVAQPLPLTHLATDELAAKPKAEAFRPLGLNDQILADLAAMGWKDPSPIQAAAIPVALTGRDLIGQAQTGTGKTAGFVLPTLQKLYALDGEGPVALMLCPTRELAKQVYNEFIKMAGTSAARAALIYGGVDMNEQVRALERKPHVVIGTPGRVIDHMKRHNLDLSKLATIVLDEADQMLDIGFWPDVTYIMSHTPPTRQVLLFSATFPDQVKELAEKHMKDPERVQIAPAQVTVSNVDQKYIAVPRERKNELLARFIETFNPPQLVVFCKTKHQTDRVAEVLKRKHMSAGAIHGDLPQSKREKTLQAFRAGELQCLVATNVAARGLDIPSVSHVVNFDVPETPEEYVHRIGRTARNGASGVARTFITSEDGQFLLEIEKHIGLLLEEEQVEGFTLAPIQAAATRTIADAPVGTPRLLKPLIGGIRLGRRR